MAVKAFHVPSGSMAPALYGHHRVCACTRCGQDVVVGRHSADRKGTGEPRFYRKAFCPNCGHYPVPVAEATEVPGDQILVNKTAYYLRSPSRWEIVVFRLLGTFYIKRLLGLPGEEIRVHDGDLYVNGQLARKSFAEARAMRVLVFEQDRAPKNDPWERPPAAPVNETSSPSLALRAGPLTYRHLFSDTGKCEPIRDEYAYNAGQHADSECVHDFLIETEIEATVGRGSLSLRLCDGHDSVEVLVPIGQSRTVEAFTWPIGSSDQTRKLVETQKKASLRIGQRYRVELAFVDRRLSLSIDGKLWLSADLPAVTNRQGVERPFQAHVDGVQATLRHFRLYRDVHYGQQGNNAVRGKSVRLAAGQYFMLGDNSSNSEDSRYWPDEGRIDGSCLVGPMIHVRAKRN